MKKYIQNRNEQLFNKLLEGINVKFNGAPMANDIDEGEMTDQQNAWKISTLSKDEKEEYKLKSPEDKEIYLQTHGNLQGYPGYPKASE